jgi:hypothetical protein
VDTDARGRLRRIKRAVTFTEKTRYLFEIREPDLRLAPGIRAIDVAW